MDNKEQIILKRVCAPCMDNKKQIILNSVCAPCLHKLFDMFFSRCCTWQVTVITFSMQLEVNESKL